MRGGRLHVAGGDHSHYHFHVEFYPPMRSRDRLKFLAGSELGAGMFINDTLAEEKAAEHRFVGSRCGIMDQLTAVAGRAGHALLIDCRTLDTTPIPMPEDRAVVLVCDSGVRHRLAASAYNDRRGESEAALCRLARERPERRTLRDVEPDRGLSAEAPGNGSFRLQILLAPRSDTGS